MSSDGEPEYFEDSFTQKSNKPSTEKYSQYSICNGSQEKVSDKKTFDSMDEFRKDAFHLYPECKFDEDNAILTYWNNNNVETLLTDVPSQTPDHPQIFYIRFVNPWCDICWMPFSIIEDKLPLHCTNKKCSAQYCKKCVEAIQGAFAKHPFECNACKMQMTPQRNLLLELHIIWKSMHKLYGVQNLNDVMKDSNYVSWTDLKKDINLRRLHLECSLETLQSRLRLPVHQKRQKNSQSLFDQQLIQDVKNLCAELKELHDCVNETVDEIIDRGVSVKECLEKYKKEMKHFDRLCHTIIKSINNLVTKAENPEDKEHIRRICRMENLDKLPSANTIEAIDTILPDISFRTKYLSTGVETIKSVLKEKTNEIEHHRHHIEKVEKKLKSINTIEENLTYLRGNLRAVEKYIEKYDKLLQGDPHKEIKCSKFIILLEKMRELADSLQLAQYFPKTVQLVETWQNDFGTDGKFKPKVVELFKSLGVDVATLFADNDYVNFIPYKVGVIGSGSVGKTTLIIKLGNLEKFSSMIHIERSTFGYLEYNARLRIGSSENDVEIPLTFIDLEGATDTKCEEAIGNYFELIRKADCDAYIIVFDQKFSEHNRACQEYIQNKLKRKYLLVRNKSDQLFNQYFTEQNDEDPRRRAYRANMALEQVKNFVKTTADDKRLHDTIYLTAANSNDNSTNAPFTKFDLGELKKKLIDLASADVRIERVYVYTINIGIAAINTCFRRGYAVSKAKYKVLAALGSIIPFLDEVPAFFGREQIRKTTGVHDKEDAFEKYLKETEIEVPTEMLKSGHFKYLRPKKKKNQGADVDIQSNPGIKKVPVRKNGMRTSGQPTEQIARHSIGSIAKPTVVVVSVVGNVADDAVRLIVPVGSASLRAASIAGIVVGAALIPVFAAWSYYSAGKRMKEHLHLLCNDLIIIIQYFAEHICNKHHPKIEPMISTTMAGDSLSSSDSSSSDDDTSSNQIN